MLSEGVILDIASVYDDYYHSGAGTFGIADHWSDRQYLSDGYLHPGADADFCSKDHCRVFDIDAFGRMDAGQNGRFHDKVME